MPSVPDERTTHRLDVSLDPDTVLGAVEEATRLWGGTSERTDDGIRLRLPVQAGLRHGELRAEARVEQTTGSPRLELSVRESSYRIHRHGTALLVLGALAAVVTVVWPFWPALSGLVPVALIVAVATWFLVIARLENRGTEEFVGTVKSVLEERPPHQEALGSGHREE